MELTARRNGWTEIEVYIERWLMNISSSLRRLLRMILTVIIGSHWIGCVWLFTGQFDRRIAIENNRTRDDWIYLDEQNPIQSIEIEDSPEIGYLRSVYWALVSMTTVGYGDIVPINVNETLCATLVVLFGGLAYPAVVGAIASLMGNLNATRAKFTSLVNMLRKYMDYKNFPESIRVR